MSSFQTFGSLETTESENPLLYGDGSIKSIKYISLKGEGSSDTITKLNSYQTENKFISLPIISNTSDSLISLTSSDILINKNLLDKSNKTLSLGIITSSDNILYFNTSSPTAPNQVLVTTGSDTTVWQQSISSSDISILLSDSVNTGVVPGTYGSNLTTSRIIVNNKGKLTYASDVAITFPTTTLISAGGTFTLVSDGLGPDLSIKGITAGSNIIISDLGTSLSINSTLANTTLTSAGGAFTLVSDDVGPDLSIKGITAGSNIAISDLGTSLSINSLGDTLTSAGGTFTLVCDGLGPAMSVKGLTAGYFVGISDLGTSLSISRLDASLTSAGGAFSLICDMNTFPDFKIKGFNTVPYMIISDLGTNLSFNTPLTTLTSTGGDFSLVSDGVGPTLSVRPILPTGSISVTSLHDQIVLTNLMAGWFLRSAGGTFTLVYDSSGPDLSIKGITGDNNIVISDLGTNLVINSNLVTSSIASAGGTFTLVCDSLGPNLSIKGISVGNNVIISDLGTNIFIDNPINLTSTGGTFSLVCDSLGPNLSIKGFNAGTNVVISDMDTNLFIDIPIGLTSTGGTFTLVCDSSGPDLSIKGLTAGNNIIISDLGTNLFVSIPDVNLVSTGGAFSLVCDSAGPDLSIKGFDLLNSSDIPAWKINNGFMISDVGSSIDFSSKLCINSLSAMSYGHFTYQSNTIPASIPIRTWYRIPLNTTVVSGGDNSFLISTPPTLVNERIRLSSNTLNGDGLYWVSATVQSANMRSNYFVGLFSSTSSTTNTTFLSGLTSSYDFSLRCPSYTVNALVQTSPGSNTDIEIDIYYNYGAGSSQILNFPISDVVLSGGIGFDGQRTATFFNNAGVISSQIFASVTVIGMGGRLKIT